jgi:hypothetical protein
MSTCNRLVLATLGYDRIGSKISPDTAAIIQGRHNQPMPNELNNMLP